MGPIRASLILAVGAVVATPASVSGQSAAGAEDRPPMTMTLYGEAKEAGGRKVTHGPMLGRAGERSMGIWVRTNKPTDVYVYYGTEPSRLSKRSKPIRTRIEDDNSGWMELGGLEPDTRYYFAVGFSDILHQAEMGGSFRTLPSAAQYRNAQDNPRGLFNFSFAATGCARMGFGGSAGYTPQRTMMQQHGDEALFALHAGDYVYEEGRHAQVEEWLWRMGRHIDEDPLPKNVSVAPRIVGAWENYKIYLDRNNYLAEWHRHVPTYYAFDDHEIINNVYGAATPNLQVDNPKRLRSALYRDIGLSAWDDYLGWSNPVEDRLNTVFGKAQLEAGSDVLYDPEADFRELDLERQNILHIHWNRPTDGTPRSLNLEKGPGDPNAQIYGVEEIIDRNRLRLSHPAKADTAASPYTIGGEKWAKFTVGNVEFFVLDTRGNRDAPAETFDMNSEKTMLGARQKEWLIRSMKESDADIFVVLSSVNLAIPHLHYSEEQEEFVGPDEAWTGYMSEREELIELWDSMPQPVLVIDADLHNAFSAKVTDNVWEFTASPINSENQHTFGQEGGRPSNGVYRSGNRDVDIRWSTFSTSGTPRGNMRYPVYVMVKVNNVFENRRKGSEPYWVAYEHPQVIVQFFHALTGELLYAESVVAGLDK